MHEQINLKMRSYLIASLTTSDSRDILFIVYCGGVSGSGSSTG